MSGIDRLLGELKESATNPLHKRLVEAYERDHDYAALLAECKKYMQEKIDEIEEADSGGTQRVQREPQR